MPPLFVGDVAVGALAIICGLWLRRHADRQRAVDPDDRIIARDLASALRTWGAAVLLLGLLGLSGLPGGFDLPVWSVLVLGTGAVSGAIVAVRWNWEGWALGDTDQDADGAIVESETWQYGLLSGAATAFVAYFIGLAIGSMQPVHIVVALLAGAAGYPLGLVIATPRTKIRVRPRVTPEAIAPVRSRGRMKRRRGRR